MIYGPNDFETCLLYEGSIDPTLVHFDPLEVEGIVYYRLEELYVLIQKDEVALSSWFVQLVNWYVGKPSELQVLRAYSHNRLLLPAGT
jgi:isopentenyldiphosphate isomerase